MSTNANNASAQGGNGPTASGTAGQANQAQNAPAPGRPLTFADLPEELKVNIFTEAIRKPQVHYFLIEMRRNTHLALVPHMWEPVIRPTPKNSDKSGYRFLQELADVCSQADDACRLAMGNPRRMPTSHQNINEYDADTDLIYFTSVTGQDGAMWWHPDSQQGNDHLNAAQARFKFGGIQRVAFPVEFRAVANAIPFSCICDNAVLDADEITGDKNLIGDYDIDTHALTCPFELAGFLHLFSNLAIAYIVVTLDEPAARREFQELDRRLPPAMRRSRHKFHDKTRTLLEITGDFGVAAHVRDMGSLERRIYPAFVLATRVKRHLEAVRRARIDIKVLAGY